MASRLGKQAWLPALVRTVVVSAAAVSSPVAVRYAWDDDPVCNLMNREGLQASPFRAPAK